MEQTERIVRMEHLLEVATRAVKRLAAAFDDYEASISPLRSIGAL